MSPTLSSGACTSRCSSTADSGSGVDQNLLDTILAVLRPYAGARRKETADALHKSMLARAAEILVEQANQIEKSLAQDKVKEYRRRAEELKQQREQAERDRNRAMVDVLRSLDTILDEDAKRRAEQRAFEATLDMTKEEKARFKLAGGARGQPQSAEDLMRLFPGAQKTFVIAVFQANGGKAGIAQTLDVLKNLKQQGVFQSDWDPEDEDDDYGVTLPTIVA